MEERHFIVSKKTPLKKEGSEAILYDVNGQVYKEFKINVHKRTLKAKKDKLIYLNHLKHLAPYYPHIYTLITSILDQDKLKGYIMENILGQHISELNLSYEEKITILKTLRSILESFNKEGIFYHDIRFPNIIMTPNNHLILLDIDSITTPDNPFMDIIPSELDSYIMNGGTHGLNSQIAMFNLFTNHLLGDNYYDTKKPILDQTGLNLILALRHSTPDSAFDHEYLYEHITRK